jgi:CRP/FNR family transcriptional regulator, cyclic AMP receptor protein
MTTQIEFRKGDTLFHQDSTAEYVLRLVRGEVEVLREIGGASVVLGHVREGEWLGEMAVIENRSHSATAHATTDCVVESLTARQFLDRISSDPVLARNVILRLSVRLRRIDDRVAGDMLASTGDIRTVTGRRGAPDTGVTNQGAILLQAKTDALRDRIGASAVPISRLPFVVGRIALDAEEIPSRPVDLLIEDNPPFRLSRQHFMIARSGEQLLVSDLGSALGTIVNGQPIGHHFRSDAVPLSSGENDVLAGGRGSLFEFVINVT